jgi:hypothetical protein
MLIDHEGVIFKVCVGGDHITSVKCRTFPRRFSRTPPQRETSPSLVSSNAEKYYEDLHLAIMPTTNFVNEIAARLPGSTAHWVCISSASI